jgi:hypothetical protein
MLSNLGQLDVCFDDGGLINGRFQVRLVDVTETGAMALATFRSGDSRYGIGTWRGIIGGSRGGKHGVEPGFKAPDDDTLH